MNTRSAAGIVGLGLLLCSYVTAVAAECGFGALCDKTVRMLFFPVRACDNGSCSDDASLDRKVSAAYLASDGTVLTHFGNWWGIPGVGYDTFVCRSASNKSVSRSCYGANCKPDIVDEVLKSVHMIDSCSVAGNGDNLTITLLKKVSRSENNELKSPSLDTDLRVQINVKSLKEEQSGEYKCDADIHASARFYPTPKPRPDVTDLNYEYDGAVKTAKSGGFCDIYDGNTLFDIGDEPGKVIDAGP
jgi:hypothetical protein